MKLLKESPLVNLLLACRIPLVPRRPTSAEGFFPIQTPAGDKGGGKGTKSRAGKKEKEKLVPSASIEEVQESPQPPVDPDEKV